MLVCRRPDVKNKREDRKLHVATLVSTLAQGGSLTP